MNSFTFCDKCGNNLDNLNYNFLKLDCGHKICDKCILANLDERNFLCNIRHNCYTSGENFYEQDINNDDAPLYIKMESIDKIWEKNFDSSDNAINIIIENMYYIKIKKKKITVNKKNIIKYGSNFCSAAIKINKNYIELIPENMLTDDMLFNLLKNNINLLSRYYALIKSDNLYVSLIIYKPKYIREICYYLRTKKIIKYLLNNDLYTYIKYINPIFLDINLLNYIAKKNCKALYVLSKYIRIQYDTYLISVGAGYKLKHVPPEYRTTYLCLKALTYDGDQIKYTPKKNMTVCFAILALKKSPKNIKYIPSKIRDIIYAFD